MPDESQSAASAPASAPDTPSDAARASRVTRVPAAPPAPSPTAAQIIADNLSTRLREITAFACYIALARWGLIPGTWALFAIGMTVLPIEITRQIVKVGVARSVGGAGVGGGAALALAGVVYKAHAVLTTAPLAAAAVAYFAGCGR